MVLPLLRGRAMRVVPRPITSLHFNCPTLSSGCPPEEISAKGIKVKQRTPLIIDRSEWVTAGKSDIGQKAGRADWTVSPISHLFFCNRTRQD